MRVTSNWEYTSLEGETRDAEPVRGAAMALRAPHGDMGECAKQDCLRTAATGPGPRSFGSPATTLRRLVIAASRRRQQQNANRAASTNQRMGNKLFY